MTTITQTRLLSPPFSEPLQLLFTIPKKRPVEGQRNRVALSLVLSPPSTLDNPIGCYVYSIYDPRKNEVYQTILNNSEESLFEITKRISNIITKKYQTPTFVCMNGSIDPLAVLGIIRELIEVLESQWSNE